MMCFWNRKEKMTYKANEIICSACGKETMLLREANYDGFIRTGDVLRCASCGHIYADESDVAYKEIAEQKVFTDADRPEAVHVFSEGENKRLCRYCNHYVVNPFMQWCGIKRAEVQATDTCEHFEEKTDGTADEISV